MTERPEVSLHYLVTVLKDGQINIPKSLCEAIGIKEGDRVYLSQLGDHLTLHPYLRTSEEIIAAMHRYYEGHVWPTEELLAQRRWEAAKDEEAFQESQYKE